MSSSTPELESAVLAALRPRGAREWVRARTLGGWTALQVAARLDEGAAAGALAAVDGPARERALVEVVRRVLVQLAESGRVRRRSSSYGATLAGKGTRKVVVDLFRLA